MMSRLDGLYAHDCLTDGWMTWLTHAGTPVIRPMKNVTTVAGEELLLRCYVSGYPVHAITWIKGQHLY